MVRLIRADGPKPQGKKTNSKNSLKTHAYSLVAVLSNENQERFDQLLAHVRYDLKLFLKLPWLLIWQ